MYYGLYIIWLCGCFVFFLSKFYYSNCIKSGNLALNYLCRYYADLEKKRCPIAMGNTDADGHLGNNTTDPNACIVWRRFAK